MLLVMLNNRECLGLFHFRYHARYQVLSSVIVTDQVLDRPLFEIVVLFALYERLPVIYG
jgi:hypothetical protein